MIVVTTPTGQIGRHVLNALMSSDEEMRAIARDPSKVPDDVRRRVEVVEGSHADPAAVDCAFRGADAVFWLCPPVPRDTPEAATVEFTRPAADAIERHGIQHVVAATTLGRGTPWQDTAGMATASIRMVDLLRSTGIAVRGLALPGFMDNALHMLDGIRQGVMQGAIRPDVVLPHVAARDIGTAAARLLLTRDWDGQKDVPVVGPTDHSYADLARIVTEVTGRDVAYRHVSFDTLQDGLRQAGWPPAFAAAYVDMLRAKDAGMDTAAPRDEAIVGATDFHRWVEEDLKPRL